MKKLLLVLSLTLLVGVAMAYRDRTGFIKTGYTMLSEPMTMTAADTINTSETVTWTITNLQKYAQNQVFSFDLTAGTGSPSVAITAYGRVTATSAWVQIGTPITWTSNSQDGDISSTSPINYNYFKVTLVASGATQHVHITSFVIKTSNAYDIPASSGTLTISRATSGTVTITSQDDDANCALTVGAGGTGALTIGDANSTLNLTSDATISVVGAINQAIAGGTVVTSAGLLGGGGTSTSATQTLGAAGGKAFSYYLSSTSTTASHVLQGYYMNVSYGTSGASAAPSGDVIRGRAWLVGDASGTSALTGGAFSVELAAVTASNTGLTAGMRGNLVLPDGVLTNAGTYYGTEAEIYLGGAATDTRAYTSISPLGIVISGTAATDAAQLSNVTLMDISVPANMVTTDGTLVVTGATGAVAAGLKIKINGTYYWIMLATADE